MSYVDVQGRWIPTLGFGTWKLTGSACHDAVAHALAVGYRHLDTAQMYGNEDVVGQALEASAVPREDVWLTTKLLPENLPAARVRASTEESLRALRTEYLDLLLIHWPSREVALAETLEAMAALVDDGLIGAVGVSNFPPSLVREARAITPIIANQVEYHPYLSQDALLALAREHDHLLTAYSPLARGRVLDEPVIVAIAEEHGATPAQVTLAWLLAQDHVAAIPKATSPSRIESNLAAADLTLSGEELARITALDEGPAGRIVDPPLAADWER